jgi:hypothetical protein
MPYPDAAWERAMTVQEVMLKALSGELHWFTAADILGWSAPLEAANRYLADQFVPQHHATFARAPRDPASAFVALGPVDLDAILFHEEGDPPDIRR